jgi:hypothetical protein
MNVLQPRVVLNLSTSEGSLGKRELVWGTPVAPFSVGASGDWRVVAPGVDERQLFLAFDGYRLHAAAVSAAHRVYVDGGLIGTEWTHVAVPSLLVFGAASIAVDCEDGAQSALPAVRPRPIIDLSRADQQPTQVVDLSRTLQVRTLRLEVSKSMLDELRDAPAEQPAFAVPRSSAPAPGSAPVPAAQSGDTLIFQPAPVRTLIFPLPLHLQQRAPTADLGNTLYDGGALRERAAQLAAAHESADAAPCAASVPAPPRKPSGLRRTLTAFRSVSLPKQLTIALLPLAMVGVWAMRDGSASASSATTLSVAAGKAKPRLAVVQAPPARPAVPVPTPPPTSPAVRPPAPESVVTQVRPADATERSALIAAFSGNRTEAAALYERLASTHNSRTFALAARLSREDHVRTP